MKRSMKSLNLGLALLTLTAATAAMGDELSEQIVTKVSVGAGVTDQGPGVAAMFSSYGRSGGYLNVFTGKNWDNNDQYLRLQAGGEIGLKKRNYYRWGNFQQDFMSFDGQFTFKNLNSCNSDGSNQNDCVGTNGDMPNRQLDIVNALAGNTVGPHSNPTMNALYPFAGNGHLLIGLFPSSVAAGGARDAGHGFTVSGYARLGITAIKGGASMDQDGYTFNLGPELWARMGARVRKGNHALVGELSGGYFYDIMGYLPQKFTQDAVVPDASGKNIGAVGWGIGSENAGVGAGNSHGNFQAFLGYENINRTGEIRAGVLLQGNSWNVWANDTSGVVNRDTSPGESKAAMLQLTFTPRVTQKGEKHEYTNEVREMADWRKKPQMKSAPVAVAVVGALPSQAVMAAAASAAVVAPITAAAAAAQ